MTTNKDIDDFCRRMHIKDDCTIDGEKIGICLLIELLDKFAQEQVKKCNLHNVSNNEVAVCEKCNGLGYINRGVSDIAICECKMR